MMRLLILSASRRVLLPTVVRQQSHCTVVSGECWNILLTSVYSLTEVIEAGLQPYEVLRHWKPEGRPGQNFLQ